MAGMQLADTSKLNGKQQEMLSKIEKSLGVVPNVMKQMANSPAALESFMSAREALTQGFLDEPMRLRIGITIAEIYSCEYLLSSRVTMAKKFGMKEEEIELARQQSSKDPKVDIGLTFVRNMVLRHGEIASTDVPDLKAAGYTEGEIVELIANISWNMWAYYMIQIAQPEMDLPKVATAFPA